MSKLLIALAVTGLVIVLLISIVVLFALIVESEVWVQAYPELAHMQFPVLLLSQSIVLLYSIVFILGIIFMLSFREQKAFTARQQKLVASASFLLYSQIIPALILILYTDANVSGSITNAYVIISIAVSTMLGSLLLIMSRILKRGIEMQREWDLTV
jgi:hypothetical protein